MAEAQKNRRCRKCNETKSVSEFCKNNSRKSGYDDWCITCKTNQRLIRTYGIGLADYYSMEAKQGKKCAICSGNDPGNRKGFFSIDHCHSTGQVRGLLCSSCNTAIGLLQDSPSILSKALEYLNGKPNGDDVQSKGATQLGGEAALEKIYL